MKGTLIDPEFWLKYRIETQPVFLRDGTLNFLFQAEGAFKIELILRATAAGGNAIIEYSNGSIQTISNAAASQTLPLIVLDGKPYIKRKDVFTIRSVTNAELTILRHLVVKNNEIKKNDSFTAK